MQLRLAHNFSWTVQHKNISVSTFPLSPCALHSLQLPQSMWEFGYQSIVEGRQWRGWNVWWRWLWWVVVGMGDVDFWLMNTVAGDVVGNKGVQWSQLCSWGGWIMEETRWKGKIDQVWKIYVTIIDFKQIQPHMGVGTLRSKRE